MTYFLRFTLLVLLCSLLPSTVRGQSRNFRQNAPDQNVTAILNTLFDTYDDRVRPGLGERPLKINMTLYILNFVEIEDKKHGLTTQMYIRRWWQDSRLVHKGNPITLDGEHGARTWSPDIFFANEVDMAHHDFAKKNSFTKISPDGTVKISDKITVTTSCPMMLAYFPYDSQICSMDIESYGYTASDIILEWAEGSHTSVGVSPVPQINDFYYIGHRISDTITYLSTGNYSRLAVELAWKRIPSWHIWTLHVPLALVSLVAIFPLLSSCRSAVSPVVSMLPIFASIFLGVSSGRDLFQGSYAFVRFYIIMNWSFVTLAALVSISYAFVAKKQVAKGTSEEHTKSPSDFKRLVRDELGAIVTLGIFIVMNFVYWGMLCGHSNVDMGNDWIKHY